ncbi:MAG: hypothetical protein HY289_12440 [Planctomycetes bacterium]|nr:hypothetical protein [Planctomycetota bacterium]
MTGSIHLIHIGDRAERQRAIQAFLDVPETWASFPGDVLGVTGKHLDALQRATPPITFEPAKKAHVNGQNPPVQSK